jgi:adenine-specific DNA methylase
MSFMQPRQLPLFPDISAPQFNAPFPSTRYQGSKRKLMGWIREQTASLAFDSVLDVFGGTGAVSYLFKNMGKQVTYNDYLAFNWNIGLALIENSSQTLSQADIEIILRRHPDQHYPDFIQRTFSGIYFTDDENAWLDQTLTNINARIHQPYQQAIARFALFQACIIKRPYNLFHRANLYMRTSNVDRSFGNKTTWDAPFEEHFRTFAAEANAAVFDNGKVNRAVQVDALDTPVDADLVYIDPPYFNAKGVGVNYRDFYHFLEGMMQYDQWAGMIDLRSKHRRLQVRATVWDSADRITGAFDHLIDRHRRSTLVISYRDDGIPSREDLVALLRTHGKQVIQAARPQQYVLSDRKSHELLLIGM